MRIVSFDPGKTTGYSIWEVSDRDASLVEYGIYSVDTKEFFTFLQYHPDVVIIEKVRKLRPSMESVPLEMAAIIRFVCICHDIPHIFQESSILHAVTKWGTIPKNLTKVTHEFDAIAHGVAYIRLHYSGKALNFDRANHTRYRGLPVARLPETT